MPTEAKSLIAANTSFWGNLDEAQLGSTLAKVAVAHPALVREVFNQLSSSDRVQVSQGLVAELIRTDRLNKTAATYNGSTVLRQVSTILDPSDANKVAVVDQALANSPLTKSQTVTASTSASTKPRELAANEIPKSGNPAVRFELPEQGVGYHTYKRNDTPRNYKKSDDVAPELQGKHIPDQVGTKDTIERIETLAKEWNEIHSDRPLQIGDISLAGGGYTPDHHTHQDGRNVDVRPLRNDSNFGKSASLNYLSKEYDQKLTIEFVQLVLKKYPNTRFYFNDPVLKGKFPNAIKRVDDHNDHLHIIFSPKDDLK